MDDFVRSNGLNRRELLGSAALAAALGQEPPAAGVEDRGSGIRIAALRAVPVGPKVFVRIDTNRKTSGWGEITGLVPKVAAALAESLFELLDGENPTRIEHLWQKLFRAHRDMRGGPFMLHTISAIDMALWDIAGKLHGVPVFRLLGGPCRDKVRVYPTPKAIKTACAVMPQSADPPDVERVVEAIRSARKQVGPDGTVMFDAHCAVPPAVMVQLGSAIASYDVLFIEEPAVPGNIEVFKRIRAAIKTPLATGERDRTIWEMLPYLQHGAIDVLQPDCGHTGGISQMKKIAALAEAFHVPLAPHSIMTHLGLSASMHVAASVPLFLIQEMNTNLPLPEGVARVHWKVGADGYASLPQGPGLGVEVDEARLERLAAELKAPVWPSATAPDGSIRDY
jgi:galactonate dehydratase